MTASNFFDPQVQKTVCKEQPRKQQIGLRISLVALEACKHHQYSGGGHN